MSKFKILKQKSPTVKPVVALEVWADGNQVIVGGHWYMPNTVYGGWIRRKSDV